ncbi:uncharacterized protein N0V89_003459 [Didymosphaeria variabile]|uniref:DUF4267 domain-containing protein n=1 Tax=Didymosphaeria variabile TaxID=1932322 RepID=A0A9W8XQA9_9PLEO|nr:uncharacterized protein N0V89_003459 [Didymosphaeria variabile]KAJ4355443.1 hypothetical protein N0V89_003459 [Didymosphaeria variabile]
MWVRSKVNVMNSTTLTLTIKAVTLIFALASLSTGLQAITSPITFATTFGIPLPPSPKHENPATTTSYISLLGARQLATGITLLVFAYQGKWVETATILSIIGVVVAGMDGYHIARRGSSGGGLFHAVPGALIAGLAAAVLYVGV